MMMMMMIIVIISTSYFLSIILRRDVFARIACLFQHFFSLMEHTCTGFPEK
jgi:hypothetical protein